jgi:hypothetical protein
VVPLFDIVPRALDDRRDDVGEARVPNAGAGGVHMAVATELLCELVDSNVPFGSEAHLDRVRQLCEHQADLDAADPERVGNEVVRVFFFGAGLFKHVLRHGEVRDLVPVAEVQRTERMTQELRAVGTPLFIDLLIDLCRVGATVDEMSDEAMDV